MSFEADLSRIDAHIAEARRFVQRQGDRPVRAGKEATAEFGDYHSAEAVAHMAHFRIGDLVETPTTLP